MNKNQILSECIVIFDKHLQVNLKEAMSQTLKKLFNLAENATSNQQEQELFNQYRQLKTGGKLVSNLVSAKTKSMPEFISVEVNKSDNKMSLSLVQDEELSITLALTQLDSTLEVVSHAELFTLEKRMNVIFGNEQIDKTNMPFSPASIVWLFSHAFKSTELAVQVKTMILEYLTREFSKNINQAYHEINDVFINAGILPNIEPEAAKAKRREKSLKKESKEQQDNSDGFSQEGLTGMENQANQQVGRRSNQSVQGGQGAQSSEGMHAEFQSEGRQYDPQTEQLVESIFDLLSPPTGSSVQSIDHPQINQSRDGSFHTGQGSSGEQSDGVNQGFNSGSMANQTSQASQSQRVADYDFDQALAQIAQDSGVVATSKNIHNLKEMLTNQVRNATGNYYPELSPKQNKTLDLMGLVYDEIEKDDSIDSHIRSSFNAINVPLLRMAVNDASFFSDAAHPARKFMELLVESSQKWHGTNVIKKVHQFSDSAAKSFDGSTKSFVSALKALTQYLEVTENRAQKAEKKWVSAAQGKEKMELTKAEVEEHLNQILEGCEIKFIRDIISHVWKDSLTLTLLREGKGSEQWAKKTKSAKDIASIGNKEKFMNLSGSEKLAAMHHLDETMDQLGFSKRDRVSTKDNIHACFGWQESQDDDTGKPEKPVLKKILSIDEAVKSHEIESANKKIEEIRELNDDEKLIMEKVINMPYGSLFDFIINQQNEKLRRKLSWVSTMSETVLFVDLVGRHPHKMKLPRLAIDLVRKNIIRVELQQGGYFKNALSNIMSRLKKMAA